jgi:uncharacterized protein YjeT (DUF2065 family)
MAREILEWRKFSDSSMRIIGLVLIVALVLILQARG